MKFEISPRLTRLSSVCVWIADWYEGATDYAENRKWNALIPIYDGISKAASEWSELPARQIKPAIREYMDQISEKAKKERNKAKFRAYDDILDTLERNISW